VASLKNLTRAMKVELGKKCKIKADKYGYTKNTPDFIELIERDSGKTLIINKSDYNIHF